MSEPNERIQALANSIRARGAALDALAQQLRSRTILDGFDKWDHKSWCTAAAGDALVRLRLLTEQNFVVLETLGVVAVARYIFETALWLRLFAVDQLYGLVYFDQLIRTQQRFYQDYVAQLEREIAWLTSLGEKEAALHREALMVVDRTSGEAEDAKGPSALVAAMKAASAQVDADAARRFSIFAKDAEINGYAFQSHLVRTKALPQAQLALEEIAAERALFESRVSAEVKNLRPSRWEWRRMAQKAGLEDQYDYIYAYASKLLHATPASITTSQKNLEITEMEMFLKYISVTLDDIQVLAKTFHPASVSGHMPSP